MSTTKIFIGSGHEDAETAQDLADGLTAELPDADVELWNKSGVFELSKTLFDELLDKADRADYSVLLLSNPVIDEESGALRGVSPNVMFELGLFYGRLERYRTIIVSQGEEAERQLPADLKGVKVVKIEEDAAPAIAAQVRKYGKRVPPTVELGSLERMLNVCTPAHDDTRTPHLSTVWPQRDEHFDTARDYFDLCRALLLHYIIGSMTPEQAAHMRAYLAVYIGDGIHISAGGTEGVVRRCEPRRAESLADSTFLIGLSNPWEDSSADLPRAPELLKVHWRVARGIPGFENDDRSRPRSNCAFVFDTQREKTASSGESHNQTVDDEKQVFATPILWKELHHTASMGVLGLSMDAKGSELKKDSLLARIRLVGNVLGVAAGRLAENLQTPTDHPVGVRAEHPEDRRSFSFRAVELRRAIGQHVIERLIQDGKLEIRDEDGESVLARRT